MKQADIELYMNEALNEAKKALEIGELPIGAVIVKNNNIIGRGHNSRDIDNLISRHAEIVAIENANKVLNNWRLDDCYIFVTLEPCVMCSGAIEQARISRVYYGASDEKEGFFSQYGNTLNRRVDVFPGIKENECKSLIESFFKTKRNKKQ